MQCSMALQHKSLGYMGDLSYMAHKSCARVHGVIKARQQLVGIIHTKPSPSVVKPSSPCHHSPRDAPVYSSPWAGLDAANHFGLSTVASPETTSPHLP